MRTLIAALAASAAVVSLAACGGPPPDTAACRASMARAYAAALHDGPPAAEPPACYGIPVATLNRYAVQILRSEKTP